MKIMNRIFAAAMTAALALGTLAALPASAEETPAYQMGDVNMDGKVDTSDAMLMLKDYVRTMIGAPPLLTEEQYALADLDGYTFIRTISNAGDPYEVRSRVTVYEAHVVLVYYTYTQILEIDCSMEDLEVYQTMMKKHKLEPESYVKS